MKKVVELCVGGEDVTKKNVKNENSNVVCVCEERKVSENEK